MREHGNGKYLNETESAKRLKMKKHTKERNLHRGKPFQIITGMILLLLLGAAPLFAEEDAGEAESGRGFLLGLRMYGSSLHVDDQVDDTFFIKDEGGGIHLEFGYNFTPGFSLELSLGGSTHETSDPKIDATLGMIQIFAKYHFVTGNDFRPYIKGGLGGYELRLEEGDVNASINGGGLAFGGGFDYFFTPHFSLGMDLTHNVINYEEFNFEAGGFSVGMQIDEEGAMTSLGLNVTFHF